MNGTPEGLVALIGHGKHGHALRRIKHGFVPKVRIGAFPEFGRMTDKRVRANL